MRHVKYSVIIPTRDRANYLHKCLISLSQINNPENSWEVLVVDNGSSDNTKEIAQEFLKKIPNLKYFYTSTPGLHIGRHLGCDRAEGEILCYIDDDSLVNNDWLLGIEEAFYDEAVALVGGPCIPEYETEPPKWVEYFWNNTKYGKANFFLSLLDFGDAKLLIHPRYIFGCNYSIRKNVFLELGGTHPDYLPGEYKQFQGDGESGLSRKIHASGYKTLYSPQVKIRHIIPESRLTVEYFCWRRYFNGIHASYSTIRKQHGVGIIESNEKKIVAHKLLLLIKLATLTKRGLKAIASKLIPDEPREAREIKEKINRNYEEGYRYHQEAVKSDPRLLEWILREDYLGENGRLPK
ncbi:MAG: glycosyltransferase family 2 protein [Candidatus Aminicenantaceae bacterium]